MLKKSGFTFTLTPILHSLNMCFSIPPCSFLELKKYVFIEYVYLFGLYVEIFPLKLAQGLYLACHYSQEYICYIPRALIFWFLHEKKLLFPWSFSFKDLLYVEHKNLFPKNKETETCFLLFLLFRKIHCKLLVSCPQRWINSRKIQK